MIRYKRLSSAKKRQVECKRLSCLLIRMRRGPRTVSSGTPEVIGADIEDWSSTRTCCDLASRMLVIHFVGSYSVVPDFIDGVQKVEKHGVNLFTVPHYCSLLALHRINKLALARSYAVGLLE